MDGPRWFDGLRAPVRTRFFDLFSRTVATKDGRRILGDGLRDLTTPGRLPPSAELPRHEYPELARAEQVDAIDDRNSSNQHDNGCKQSKPEKTFRQSAWNEADGRHRI